MFIQSITGDFFWQIGIQLVHHLSDKKPTYDSESIIILYYIPGITIVFLEQLRILIVVKNIKYKNGQYPDRISKEYNRSRRSRHRRRRCHNNNNLCIVYNPLLCVLIVLSLYHHPYFKPIEELVISYQIPYKLTVRTLYAGTLDTIWSTALSLPQRRSFVAQLATLCLFLATLTIAARCYALSSTYAQHQNLVQLKPPHHSSYSQIYNSNAQFYSSNLVLSRLFTTSPHQLVQSDTSIIIKINSKKLLYNQNSNANHIRTKRELKKSSAFLNSNNNIIPIKNFKKTIDGPANAPSSTAFQYLGISSSSIINSNNNKTVNSDGFVSSANNNNSVGVNISSDKFNSTIETDNHQPLNDTNFLDDKEDSALHPKGIYRPMPPVHDQASSVSDFGDLVLVLSAIIVLTVALGLVTCVLSHYRSEGGTAANPHTPTTAPMLSVVSAGAAAGVGGMDRLRGGRAARELAATRDHQVRLHAVHTDIAINLPPSIAMPDGEEHPFTSSRLHLRDPEQESEIHQKCIRPPPNRTVLESESPPPYRSSSISGLLSSSSSCSSSSSSASSSSSSTTTTSSCNYNLNNNSDWSSGSAPLVVRSHSMSSSTSATTSPFTSTVITTAAAAASAAATTTATASTTKRPEIGQKTDFLQRTVKIFTGNKKQNQTAPTVPPTLPVVIVPSSSSRRTSSSDHPSSLHPHPHSHTHHQQHHPQQQQGSSRPSKPSV